MVELTVSREDIFTYDELLDYQTRTIIQELARAINADSVENIKDIKSRYSDTKEFITAKKFLDRKCKQTWDVFSNDKYTLPIAAMKSLGITNQPSLEFLLGDSLRYFEKTNGTTTVQIIEKILNNKKLNYGIKDIHTYLAKLAQKENIRYNTNTALYLIKKHNYNKTQLEELLIFETQFLKLLTTKEHIKYAFQKVKDKISIILH